jgi:hypothetical protein
VRHRKDWPSCLNRLNRVDLAAPAVSGLASDSRRVDEHRISSIRANSRHNERAAALLTDCNQTAGVEGAALLHGSRSAILMLHQIVHGGALHWYRP